MPTDRNHSAWGASYCFYFRSLISRRHSSVLPFFNFIISFIVLPKSFGSVSITTAFFPPTSWAIPPTITFHNKSSFLAFSPSS